jgi:hypothetical protein
MIHELEIIGVCSVVSADVYSSKLINGRNFRLTVSVLVPVSSSPSSKSEKGYGYAV